MKKNPNEVPEQEPDEIPGTPTEIPDFPQEDPVREPDINPFKEPNEIPDTPQEDPNPY